MATKKKIDGLNTSEKKMSELVKLFCFCDAIFQEALFGWSIDRQIDRIGKNAKKAVEYRIGEELTANRDRRKSVEDEHRKPYQDLEYDKANDEAYHEGLKKDKEYVKLHEKEQELWDTKIDDFQFVPVKVKITNEITKKIKKPTRAVIFRDKPYEVEVYSALGYLVDEGYLVETT